MEISEKFTLTCAGGKNHKGEFAKKKNVFLVKKIHV
jgi:hypothetical protein